MNSSPLSLSLAALLPALLMLVASVLPHLAGLGLTRLWRGFLVLSTLSLCAAVVILILAPGEGQPSSWLRVTVLGQSLAVLVQLLGTVIGAFSARYLAGEAGQRVYVMSLAGVLAAVQLLLLADHWLVLIVAWALVGLALQPLLCFYPERPFARLAAHKKWLADRLADALLLVAAGLAWHEVGSGSLSALWAHLAGQDGSLLLQASAICLVLAVMLRTALLPVHGWLIQVMEAPTPVSALLHAGVVNLGGFVLIRFAPLLEHAPVARGLLVGLGLLTAVLAGMVMLTRISIKVRLAWSTVAQMGFMVLECGLGLYTLALLHLLGHSLYKAHAFLSASSAVRDTRLQMMRGAVAMRPLSLFLAPMLSIPLVLGIQHLVADSAWPWWWSVLLGLAWAPLLWLPAARDGEGPAVGGLWATGLLAMVGLTLAMLLAHALPLGLRDAPSAPLGWFALAGMSLLYLCLLILQLRPEALAGWRRWSYAGFYVDELYTRLSLRIWSTTWVPHSAHPTVHRPRAVATAAQGPAR